MSMLFARSLARYSGGSHSNLCGFVVPGLLYQQAAGAVLSAILGLTPAETEEAPQCC
jgi:hypothetical protein